MMTTMEVAAVVEIHDIEICAQELRERIDSILDEPEREADGYFVKSS